MALGVRVSTSPPAAGDETAGADSPAVSGSAPAAPDYAEEYKFYAAKIGVSERTIKRWVGDGKAAGDFCPLDDLASLPAWWTRRKRNAPPAEILHAAAAATAEKSGAKAQVVDQTASATTTGEGGANAGAKPSTAGSGESGGGDAKPKAPLLDEKDLEVISLEENLRRVSRGHAGNLALLERAYLGSTESEVTSRQRNAKLSGEMLASAQRALDDYRRERGDVVPIADVKSEAVRVHSAMAQSLLGIVLDLGVPRPRAVAAIDAWFKMLRETRFLAGTEPRLSASAPTAGA